MFKTQNGWTKETMIKQIYAKNNGTRAVDGQIPGCVYKTLDGNHCAVGCFIPENHEGTYGIGAAWDLLNVFPDLRSVMPLELTGLEQMQSVHDDCKNGENTREVLKDWIHKNVED